MSAKTKAVPPSDRYVTRAQLHTLLSEWAKAADAAMGVKVAELEQRLEQRLRAELRDGPGEQRTEAGIILPGG